MIHLLSNVNTLRERDTSPCDHSGALVAPLLRSIAAEIMGVTPTGESVETMRVSGRVRHTVRFHAPGVASLSLCMECGERAWLSRCGCSPQDAA